MTQAEIYKTENKSYEYGEEICKEEEGPEMVGIK